MILLLIIIGGGEKGREDFVQVGVCVFRSLGVELGVCGVCVCLGVAVGVYVCLDVEVGVCMFRCRGVCVCLGIEMCVFRCRGVCVCLGVLNNLQIFTHF